MVLENLSLGIFFGSDLSQYTIFFIAIIGCTLIAKIIYFFIKKYGTIIASKTNNEFDDLIIDVIGTPIVFAGFIIGLVAGYQFLTPDTAFITDNFLKIVEALVIIDLTWLSLKLVDGIIIYFLVPLSSKTDSKLDDQLIPILRKLAKASIIVLALVIILSSFGIEVMPLLAGIGVGGLAIAFAAQKTVEDMFGGLSIFISKQFVVGDAVKVNGVEGTIDSVGLRNTRVKDWDGRINVLPNSKVVSGTILNITSEPMKRVSITLGLTYSTSYAKMKKAMQILKTIVKKHPDCDNDSRAIFKDYGDSSMNLWFVYYIKNKTRKFDVLNEVNLEILNQFEKAGLDFAFPSQSVYIETMPKIRK